MDYHDSDQARSLAASARSFIDEVVIPTEREHLGGGEVDASVIENLRKEARDRDLYAPQVPTEFGGLGLNFRDVLPTFEETGRSLLGPAALRVDAPDEGNMHTLALAGTAEQKERWLRPLVAGEIVSGFSMTEPMNGAGSDPKMIQTTAVPDGDEWVINGHKWWTTNGPEADILLVLARTDPDAHPYAGCSIILVPTDTPGVELVRDIPHMGGEFVGSSHGEFIYDDVRVPAENLLGERNEGFALAQQRLGPARLTHCMRFSGMANRALSIATAYLDEREGFGSTLAEKQALRYELADAETRLHAARTMIRHASTAVAAGEEARVPVSMAKVYTANVVQDAIDLAVQCCGGHGVAKDLPLSEFYTAVRSFRIIDGADEVHKRVIARWAFDEVDSSEIEHLPRFGTPGVRL